MKISKWTDIRPGDKLKIKTDKVEVLSSTVIDIKDNLGKYVLLKMIEKEGMFYILAKIIDQNIDVRIYNEMGWLGVGDRADLLDKGHLFLFCKPEDDNTPPVDFDMAKSFNLTIDGKDIPFDQKYVMYGEAHEYPPTLKKNKLFTQVTEYSTTASVANPELMFIEICRLNDFGETPPNGGLVLPLEGYNINNDDIDKAGWF